MAKVKFPSEMPSANNIGGNDKMMIAKEGTGETYQATFDQAKQYLTIEGQRLASVAPGALPAGPAGQTRYMEVTAVGTWTYGGNPVGSNAEGYRTTFWWTGGTWVDNGSVKVVGPMPALTNTIDQATDKAVTPKGVDDAFSEYVVKPTKLSFILYGGDGTYTAEGNKRTSTSWMCTEPIAINPAGGEDIFLDGIENSPSKRVLYYTASDTTHQSPLIVSIPSGVTEYGFETPSGYVEMLITPARGTNVSSQIPFYNENLKIYRGGKPAIKAEKIAGSITTPQIVGMTNDINALKNRPDYANFEGIGFPQYDIGVNGDRYFDNSSKRIFTKLLGKWIPNSQARFYPAILPVDFGWNIGRRIMYQENGKAFIEGWKGLFEEKVKSDYDRLTKYYVSPSGNNSNNGLSEDAPLLTVEYAVGTLGARNIELAPGFYGITNNARMGVIVDNNITSDPLIIRCKNGRALMARAYLASIYTWTANGACYQAARTNVINVVDRTNLDDKKNPLQMTEVSSIALCQSTPNSYYATASVIYVHTFDNRIPDANVLLCFAETTGYEAGQNVPYVYIENLDVINQNETSGGGAFVVRNNNTVQYNTKAYIKNCFAGYNRRGNGIAIDNIKEAILEGCSGAYLLRDGLNYHTSLIGVGYEKIKVLEIDCMAYELGTKWSGESSSNASTMHEGGTILRVNTNGRKASGGVFADVNAGIRSLNIGVESSDTTLNDCIRVEGADSKLWVIGGVVYTDLILGTSIKAENGAKGFYDGKSILMNPVSGDVTQV